MFEQCLISQKRIRHRDPIDCAFASFVRSEIDGVGGVIAVLPTVYRVPPRHGRMR